MSKISIQKNHTMSDAEIKERITVMEDKLKEKFGVMLSWSSDTQADIKGTGVKGSLSLGKDTVGIDLKLGMLLRPMAGKIKETIERQVDRALG